MLSLELCPCISLHLDSHIRGWNSVFLGVISMKVFVRKTILVKFRK